MIHRVRLDERTIHLYVLEKNYIYTSNRDSTNMIA